MCCDNCKSENTYISSVSYHNAVLVCRYCHGEKQVYIKKEN